MEVWKTWFNPDTRIGFPAQRKSAIKLPSISSKQYVGKIVILFTVWKLLLLAIAYLAPGLGYDTSTAVLFHRHGVHAHSWLSQLLQDLTTRLLRWDAFYFTSASVEGKHVFEQSWAFSWALSNLSNLLSNAVPKFFHASPLIRHALAGIFISHITHLGAVISLYFLTFELLPTDPDRKRRIAFTAACLHIISPAGIFLSAAYGEAPFAFLTFFGCYYYTVALRCRLAPDKTGQNHYFTYALSVLLVAVAYMLASMLRSNGLLNGIPILIDWLFTFRALFQNGKMPDDIFGGNSKSLAALHIGSLTWIGLFTFSGYGGPQYLAYKEYCNADGPRPWCSALPPSIYSFVQKQYWHVGPFAYWTLPNLPLFALATPMLLLLFHTGWSARQHSHALELAVHGEVTPAQRKDKAYQAQAHIFTTSLRRLAAAQLVLVLMALTSFHVQIILRISSGLPCWYIVLAIVLHAPEKLGTAGCSHEIGQHYFPFSGLLGKGRVQYWVRAMAGWAILQTGLFGAFLPPA